MHEPLLVQPSQTPQQQHVPENTQFTVSPIAIASASAPLALVSTPQEGVRFPSSQSLSVPASPIVPPAHPPAQATASASTSSTPTSMRTRRTSTFRHVPSRASIAPSPLSVGNLPNAGTPPTRHLDPNKASRPQSRLSTVTLFGNSSPAEASQDVLVSKAAVSTLPQGDTDQHTVTKTPNTTSTVGPPVSVQKAPSQTPPHTSAAPSPTASPSPTSVRTGTLARSSAPYRPGFQPKGVYRPLTDEFLEVRRSHRDSGRVEQTRLERRLEKLINLHFVEGTDKRAPARPKQAKRMSSIWELDIRNMGPGDLWRGVIQSQVAPGSKADLRGVFLFHCSNESLILIIVW